MASTILVSTPDLRPSLFSILQGLAESGLLAKVATTISVTGRQVNLLSGVPFVGPRLAPILKRRQLPAVLHGKVDNIWVGELLRSTSGRVGHPLVAHAIFKWAEIGFDRIVANRYGGHFQVIYGMEHSSAATFTAQRAYGGRCVLRQVTAHSRTINDVLRRESDRFSDLLPWHHHVLMAHIDEGARRKEVEYGLCRLDCGELGVCPKNFHCQWCIAQPDHSRADGMSPSRCCGRESRGRNGPGAISLCWRAFAPQRVPPLT